VAIGLALAAAFAAGGYSLQVLISKGSPALAPALMVASLLVRLMVLAAVVIPLALYTKLNLIALLAAFAVVFTVLQVWIISVQVKRSNTPADATSAATVSSAKSAESAKPSKGSKGE
jgi:hypothetical protein